MINLFQIFQFIKISTLCVLVLSLSFTAFLSVPLVIAGLLTLGIDQMHNMMEFAYFILSFGVGTYFGVKYLHQILWSSIR